MQSYNMTIDEIEAANHEIAIVSIASLEQHGHHLPVSTDILIAQALSEGIAEKLNAYLLPTLPISTCREHMGKRGGAVFMGAKTYFDMLTDVCLCLKEQGFAKVAIVCGHGGVFVLGPAVRELNAKHNPDFAVCILNMAPIADGLYREGLIETPGLHADEFETSLMLHLRPELVKMDKAVDFMPKEPREYLNNGSIFRCCPDGVWGTPSKGTAEKGRALLERSVEEGARQILETFEYIGKKEKFGYSFF